MAGGRWRIVVCPILLILLVAAGDSDAGRISSSRHGHRRRIWPIKLRALSANEVDDSGAASGRTTAIVTNPHTSATQRLSF